MLEYLKTHVARVRFFSSLLKHELLWKSFPHEHIKKTSTCGAILTKNRLETRTKTHIIKAVRKIHTELDRTGRKVVSLEPGPLAGNRKEGEGYTVLEIFPGSEWHKPHICAAHPWGPTLVGQMPLVGLKTSETDSCRKPSLHS